MRIDGFDETLIFPMSSESMAEIC